MSTRSNFFEGFDDDDAEEYLCNLFNLLGESEHIVEPTSGFMWRVIKPYCEYEDEPYEFEVDTLINENLLCEIDGILFDCADKYGEL